MKYLVNTLFVLFLVTLFSCNNELIGTTEDINPVLSTEITTHTINNEQFLEEESLTLNKSNTFTKGNSELDDTTINGNIIMGGDGEDETPLPPPGGGN